MRPFIAAFPSIVSLRPRCQGCGEKLDPREVEGESHARVEVETYAEMEHDCGGDEAACYRRCPVAVPAQRQVQVQCGPVR